MTKTNETLTRYIKNWAVSANFKGYSSHLTLCRLTVNRSEMPNFSYTQPLGSIQKKIRQCKIEQQELQKIKSSD